LADKYTDGAVESGDGWFIQFDAVISVQPGSEFAAFCLHRVIQAPVPQIVIPASKEII